MFDPTLRQTRFSRCASQQWESAALGVVAPVSDATTCVPCSALLCPDPPNCLPVWLNRLPSTSAFKPGTAGGGIQGVNGSRDVLHHTRRERIGVGGWMRMHQWHPRLNERTCWCAAIFSVSSLRSRSNTLRADQQQIHPQWCHSRAESHQDSQAQGPSP